MKLKRKRPSRAQSKLGKFASLAGASFKEASDRPFRIFFDFFGGEQTDKKVKKKNDRSRVSKIP